MLSNQQHQTGYVKRGWDKRIPAYLITEEKRKKISEYLKAWFRLRMIRKLSSQNLLHLNDLKQTCLKHILPVTEPLVLISQIQRSGGSFLCDLFDGHPQIHARPHELMLGCAKKSIWPQIDLSDRPECWFEVLFEKVVIKHAQQGCKKGLRDQESFAFFFVHPLQKEIFLTYLKSSNSRKLRDVFDAYMTSYFGAWINNQNINGPKKIVTALTARLAEQKENMEYFFDIYPDGRLISIIRNPKDWYSSALQHDPAKSGDLVGAISQWNERTRAAISGKQHYGERMCIVAFEDLLEKTEAIMRYLAEFLGIEFDGILLVPTFNKFPIKTHTSFKAENHGVINGPLSRDTILNRQQLDTIEKMTRETYPRVLNEAVKFE